MRNGTDETNSHLQHQCTSSGDRAIGGLMATCIGQSFVRPSACSNGCQREAGRFPAELWKHSEIEEAGC